MNLADYFTMQHPNRALYAPVFFAAPMPQPTLFGKLTHGQAVEMLAQLLAAIQPLPAAPTASKNVGDLIHYQDALAQRSRRDAVVRAIGNLVARLVG